MASVFDLPAQFHGAQWKLKIRDKERTEPPHVSVLKGSKCWRWGLRERAFLDRKPTPRDVPKELVTYLGKIHGEICAAWDRMCPHNPVNSQDLDND